MKTVLVIGSGPGGTAAALKILQAGHQVIMLERGDFLPKEADNRSSQAVYGDTKYRTSERWIDDQDDSKFQPWMHYYVGGNAKLYGAALYRFRPGDFRELKYEDGLSPAWPLDYADYAPYYDEAEALYTLHGSRDADKTEPTSAPFPFPAVEDEAFISELREELDIATHPLPLGLKLESQTDWEVRLDKFDAYPDPSLAKSEPEARVLALLRAHEDHFELRTGQLVTHISLDQNDNFQSVTTESGEVISADCLVLAAGAINSARLLLESEIQPDNDLIGANYMAHLSTTAIAKFDRDLDLSFGKTFATNEWYRPDETDPVLDGSIQTQGKWDTTQYHLEEWTASIDEPEVLAAQAMEFFFMTEDLPLKENRIKMTSEGMRVHRKLTNEGHHKRLVANLEKALSKTSHYQSFHSQMMPLAWCTHQCGTLVYGENSQNSVLDLNCRLHGCENLFVTDGSFFPSSSGLNPTLTIIANALRVGEFIGEKGL